MAGHLGLMLREYRALEVGELNVTLGPVQEDLRPVRLADERVTEHLAEDDLRSRLEPGSYLGESAGIADTARPPAS